MTKSLQETLMLKHQVPFNQIHFDRFFLKFIYQQQVRGIYEATN